MNSERPPHDELHRFKSQFKRHIMRTQRLRWVLAEICNTSNYSRHRKVLHSSWKFWCALLLKFVPHVWPFQIQLRLKQGGVIKVTEFMTLFIYREIFVDGCYDVPLKVTGDLLIVDVGANTGLFIIRMKQLYPRSHIVAYEPMPSNYRQLKENLCLSKCFGCEIFSKGVGAIARKEKLFKHPTNIGGHSIVRSQVRGNNYIEIDLVDVGGMLEPLNGRACDLLKLDCEGAEYEILKSITKEMAQKLRMIIFESTPPLYDENELADHLRSIGYLVSRHRNMWLAELLPSGGGRGPVSQS